MEVFCDTIKDYQRFTTSALKVLEYRAEKLVRTLVPIRQTQLELSMTYAGQHQKKNAFHAASKDLESKTQKFNAKPDSKNKTTVEQAERTLEESKEIFETVSRTVKSEIEKFEATRSQDSLFSILELARVFVNKEIRVEDFFLAYCLLLFSSSPVVLVFFFWFSLLTFHNDYVTGGRSMEKSDVQAPVK